MPCEDGFTITHVGYNTFVEEGLFWPSGRFITCKKTFLLTRCLFGQFLVLFIILKELFAFL